MVVFCGLCLVTEDVERLTDFYDGLLCVHSERNPVHVEIKAQGAGLAVYSSAKAEEDMGLHFAKPPGSFSLQFLTEDVEGALARAQSMEAPIVGPLRKWPWGTRSFQCLDPDGNVISVAGK